MDRRAFLRLTVAGAGSVAIGGSLWRGATAAAAQAGPSPYGPLLPPDLHGISLPVGFVSRIVARSGAKVDGTSYVWHSAPDGGACFEDGDGWIYVSNSEVSGTGGASALRFSATGQVVGAYRVLSGTNRNCAGGATPWGTWLSCEEVDKGRVFETDPTGRSAPVVRLAMGRFKHEAAAVDPVRRAVYLTEDVADGCFYRFRPTTWPNLAQGNLEVMRASSAGAVTWATVPSPSATTKATRYQVSGVRRFNGGEGAWYADGSCWFTTKGDGRVWRYDAASSRLQLVYDDDIPGAALRGPDNVVGSQSGDLFVAEDGGDMQICIITPDGTVAPFLQVSGQRTSELTGPAFSPDGRRLYFSSQRGTTGLSSGGLTYEVTGPFRTFA